MSVVGKIKYLRPDGTILLKSRNKKDVMLNQYVADSKGGAYIIIKGKPYENYTIKCVQYTNVDIYCSEGAYP